MPPTSDIEPNYDREMRFEALTPHQSDQVNAWCPQATLVADLSWPQALTRVLHLRTLHGDLVVKAGGPVTAHHITREIAAGEQIHGRGLPHLLAADGEAHLLLLAYQPGTLVEGTTAEADPAVYQAAGALLGAVHDSLPAVSGAHYALDRRERLQRLLPKARSLLSPASLGHLTSAIEQVTIHPERSVATHGDFQPRNWLANGPAGERAVTLVDFGRFAVRPWYSDLVRLFHQLDADDPRLLATLDGMEQQPPWLLDPSMPDGHNWATENLYQALATLVWATDVNDLPFAAQGRAMVERCLAAN